MAKPEGVRLTVEEKRKELIDICVGNRRCRDCVLRIACISVNDDLAPRSMPDKDIERLYTEYGKLKGEPTMNEHETQATLEATIDGTIVITRAEYAYLIAKSAKIDLLEDYVNNHREYLDKDVVRAILGMYRSEESEG